MGESGFVGLLETTTVDVVFLCRHNLIPGIILPVSFLSTVTVVFCSQIPN